ncbi:hypothetical protein HDU76_013625, partial [Blyttiomyces sp. JEL0837]
LPSSNTTQDNTATARFTTSTGLREHTHVPSSANRDATVSIKSAEQVALEERERLHDSMESHWKAAMKSTRQFQELEAIIAAYRATHEENTGRLHDELESHWKAAMMAAVKIQQLESGKEANRAEHEARMKRLLNKNRDSERAADPQQREFEEEKQKLKDEKESLDLELQKMAKVNGGCNDTFHQVFTEMAYWKNEFDKISLYWDERVNKIKNEELPEEFKKRELAWVKQLTRHERENRELHFNLKSTNKRIIATQKNLSTQKSTVEKFKTEIEGFEKSVKVLQDQLEEDRVKVKRLEAELVEAEKRANLPKLQESEAAAAKDKIEVYEAKAELDSSIGMANTPTVPNLSISDSKVTLADVGDVTQMSEGDCSLDESSLNLFKKTTLYKLSKGTTAGPAMTPSSTYENYDVPSPERLAAMRLIEAPGQSALEIETPQTPTTSFSIAERDENSKETTTVRRLEKVDELTESGMNEGDDATAMGRVGDMGVNEVDELSFAFTQLDLDVEVDVD